MSRITSYRSVPYCRSTYGAMIRPVPCSALRLPSFASTRSTMSAVNASYRSSDRGSLNRSLTRKCRLPSRAWPKITDESYACVRNSSVRPSQVGSSRSTGTQMSSSSAVVPDGREPATDVYRPLRTFHSRAFSAAPEAVATGLEQVQARGQLRQPAHPPASSSAESAWCSTSSAA